jgi:hypothetical protein
MHWTTVARRSSLLAVLILLVVAAHGHTPAAQVARERPPILAQSEDTIAITNVTLVDVTSGARQPSTTVVMKAGRIIDIGPRIPVPRGAVRVDGTERFLIPGLWDMHSHNVAAGAESLELYLVNGVVGTRDMGSDVELILSLRDRVRRGELRGPEIVAAGTHQRLDSIECCWTGTPASRCLMSSMPVTAFSSAYARLVSLRSLMKKRCPSFGR